jgi:DNA-binding transcriptional regulator YiaG
MDRAQQTNIIILTLDIIYPMDIINNMTPSELKIWRKRNGYTQTELARVLGVGQVAVARWETGVRKIPSLLPLALEALEWRKKEVNDNKGPQKKKTKKEV